MSALGRLLAWIVALLLALLPIIAVLNGWFAAERWPIEHLRITAEYRRVDAEQVRAAVLPHADRGFFAVDLAAVHASIVALDWVAEVEVRKRWPNLLEVTIHEHQPFARWGETQILSARGQLFTLPAQGAPDGLPQLDGSVDRVAEIVEVYQRAATQFATHGGELSGVRLSARGSWSFRLAGGTTVMAGRGDPLPRIDRFAPHLAALKRVETRLLRRADLRYANGFALRWEEPGAGSREPGTGAFITDPPAALAELANSAASRVACRGGPPPDPTPCSLIPAPGAQVSGPPDLRTPNPKA